MIELSFFDPVNLATFNRLVKGKRNAKGNLIQIGMPTGVFIDKRYHLIPHYANRTPFKLKVSNPGDALNIDIVYISVVGTLESIPKITLVPQFVDTVVKLPVREGLNLVTITSKVNANESFTIIINSKSYATLMMAYSQELFPSLEAIREQTQAIFNPFATRLLEPLISQSELLPDIQVIQGMALRFLGISNVGQPSSDIGVENMMKSLSSNTPVFDTHTQTDTLLPAQFKIFTSQELFGGFAGHLWFPNNQLNRWLAFQRLITNLGLEIKQYDENIIEFVNLFGDDELHIFDTNIQESLLDFRKNINNFDVLTRIISTTRIPIPAAGYPFDLVVSQFSPLGNARLGLDLGSPFDQGFPFDSDPIDPLHDGFVGIPLTGRFNFDSLGRPVLDSMIGSDPTYSPGSPTGFADGYFTHDLAIFGNETTFDESADAETSVILPTVLGPNRYNEQVAEVTTPDSTFSTVTTLTETYGTGELYVGFVTWMQQGGSSVETRVTDDSVVISHNIYENEASTDYVSCGCFFHFTGAGSSRTTLLEMASTDNAATVRVKDARMLIYHINTTIDYDEVATFQSDTTTMATSYVTYQTLTFTPAFAENHIILASQDISSDSTADDIFAELDVDGTPIGEAQFRVTTTAERRNITFVWVANLPASVQTIRTRFRASGGSETVSIRNGTLAVVPFGSFTGEIHAKTATEISKHGGPDFSDGVDITWTPTVNNPTYWLASSRTRVDDVTKNIQFRLNTNLGHTLEPVQFQPAATTSYLPSILAHRNGSGTSLRTDKIEYAGDYGAFKFLDDQVLFALSLEFPVMERILGDNIALGTLDDLLRGLDLLRRDPFTFFDSIFKEQQLERLLLDSITLAEDTRSTHKLLSDFEIIVDQMIREALLERVMPDPADGLFLIVTDVSVSQRIVQTLLESVITSNGSDELIDAFSREVTLSPIIPDFIWPITFVSDALLIQRGPRSHLVQEGITSNGNDELVDAFQRHLAKLMRFDVLTSTASDELTDNLAFHSKVAERGFANATSETDATLTSDSFATDLERFFPDNAVVTDLTRLIQNVRIGDNVVMRDTVRLVESPLFSDGITSNSNNELVDTFSRTLVRVITDPVILTETILQNETVVVLSDSINAFDSRFRDIDGISGNDQRGIHDRQRLEHQPVSDTLATDLERILADTVQPHDTFGTNTLYKEHLPIGDILAINHRTKDVVISDTIDTSGADSSDLIDNFIVT